MSCGSIALLPTPPHTDAFLLQSPRAHLLSVYEHCRNHSRSSSRLPRQFVAWLGHFEARHRSSRARARHRADALMEDFGCGMNPINLQTRALTCELYRGAMQNWSATPDEASQTELDETIRMAVLRLRSAAWVGIVELFHESWCLLQHRLGGDAAARLPCYCDCGSPLYGHRSLSDTYAREPARPTDVRALPKATLSMADTLTTSDHVVYRAGVERVLSELRAMELSTGMRVICDGRLESIRNGTKYVQGLGAALSNWPGHVGSQSAVDLRYNCSAQS